MDYDAYTLAKWQELQAWCLDPKHKLYSRCGPKMLHPRWQSLAMFRSDIGPRPSEAHFLKRDKITLPFGPGNYNWHLPSSAPAPVKRSEARQAKALASRVLSDDEVRKVLQLVLTEGARYDIVAASFGISVGYAWRIVKGLARRVKGFDYPASVSLRVGASSGKMSSTERARSSKNCKLTEAEVREMLHMIHEEGHHYSGVAVAFGVSPGYAWKIATGLNFRLDGVVYPTGVKMKG